MSKETIRRCSHCGTAIHGDDYTEFDNEVLCSSCLERETVICAHCGERIWSEENAGNSYIALCQDCFDDHYTNCERCECIIHRDNANYIGDYAYCDDCYDKEKEHCCRERLHVHAVFERHRRECVPLWYNKDKRKNPITKGFVDVCRYFSILFPAKMHG